MLQIDLIFPPDRHSWNLVEGWERMVRRAGFRVRAWHLHRRPVSALLDFYRRDRAEPDLLLAVGGDLHIPELHREPEARKVWQDLPCPRVCLAYESLRDSLWPESRAKFQSSLEVFTHYAVCDEVDEPWVASQGRPARWIPQGVDVDEFRPRGNQERSIFFRGKFQQYEQYAGRRRLLHELSSRGLIQIHSRELGDRSYRRLYQRYAGALNPRGVFGGYNVRTFEALACGCVLFQQEIPDRPRNGALLRNGIDAILLPQDAGVCAEILAGTDWDSFPVRRMARQGPHLARSRHSLEDRLARILEWVGQNCGKAELLAGARILREQTEARVIAAGYPATTKERWKKIRRTFYRLWPEALGLNHRKKMLGLASANDAFGRHPTRLQQDRYVHQELLQGRRKGIFRQEGSRLAAGSPVLYLKKFWGWRETGEEKTDLLCRRGPDASRGSVSHAFGLLILDNFRAERPVEGLRHRTRSVYAESDQEYLVPRS